MAAPDVIRDMGDTLLFLLRQGIDAAIVQPANIVISTPDEFDALQNPASPTLTIFLYRLSLHAETRNAPPRSAPDGRVNRQPLPLQLHYLITPWARRTQDEHRIVGRVLQVLYDNSDLGAAQLQGDSWHAGETVQIILESLTLDDHYRIWDSSGVPYRLSLSYLVRVIPVDSAVSRLAPPVLEARFGGAVP